MFGQHTPRARARGGMLGMLSVLLLGASQTPVVLATPVQARFWPCETNYNQGPENGRLTVNEVYGTIVDGPRAAELGLPGDGRAVLRVNVFGEARGQIVGYQNDTNKLATLFVDASIGGVEVFNSASWLCNSLFPTNLTRGVRANETYCPFPAGSFGMNISIPLYRPVALTTLSTQVRVVDTTLAANTIACVNVDFTPYDRNGWYYDLMLWLPVALAVGLWAVSWAARFIAGWVIGSGVAEYGSKEQHAARRRSLDNAGRRDAKMRKWGTMIVSGISGERLSVSSALLRYVTPGLRDILHHLQYCTALGMMAVVWPDFAYPIFARGAWADLVWNNTLIVDSDPSRSVIAYPHTATLPSAFSSQTSNTTLPLYMDTNRFNPLFDIGDNDHGLEAFALAVGLRPQDLFSTCLTIFLVIAGAIIIVSLIFWVAHALTEAFTTVERPRAVKRMSYASSPTASIAGTAPYQGEKAYEPRSPGYELSELPSLPPTSSGFAPSQDRTRAPSRFRRTWLRFRPRGEAGAFHAAALYGNLLRIILIFHLPITIFSMYQLVLGSRASIVTRVFAALSFVFLSVAIPAAVLWKVHKTPSGKLYDATRTLLAMGTMYNHYVMDKQMFRAAPLAVSLVTGVVIGAGQAKGIVQAVIVVAVELCMVVLPAVWYPWAEGASLGSVSAILGIIRVCCALLVMLLSAEFSMTEHTRTWIAYSVLILMALSFLFFLFVLLTKIGEGVVRLSGGVHFDESTHPLDGGIFAAIADLDCLNGVMGGKAAARKRRKRGSRQLQRNVSAAGSLTTQQMLDRHSMGVPRVSADGSSIFPPAQATFSDGYFPNQPPLGPPPLERLSSDSRTEEAHDSAGGGAIMDAWKPHAFRPGAQHASAAAGVGSGPGSPNRTFSVVRGGRADLDSPYTVKEASRGTSPISHSQSSVPTSPTGSLAPGTGGRPVHYRNRSSAELLGSYGYGSMRSPQPYGDSPGPYAHIQRQRFSPPQSPRQQPLPLSPPAPAATPHDPLKPVQHVPLRPPMMPLAKRRSLNDLKDASGSERSGSPSPRKRSGRGWFSRDKDTESEASDDEPFPLRSGADKGTTKGKGKAKSPMSREFRESPLGASLAAQGDVDLEDGDASSDGRSSARGNGTWSRVIRFGRRRKSVNEAEAQARDENRARKAALANESGALFAGVESPSRRQAREKEERKFVVRRSGGAGAGAGAGAGVGVGTTSMGSAGSAMAKGAETASGPSTPGITVTPSEENRTFRVKRVGHGVSHAQVTRPAEVPSTKASPHSANVVLGKVDYPTPSSSGSVRTAGSASASASAAMNAVTRSSGEGSTERSFRVRRPRDKGLTAATPSSTASRSPNMAPSSPSSSLRPELSESGRRASSGFVVHRPARNSSGVSSSPGGSGASTPTAAAPAPVHRGLPAGAMQSEQTYTPVGLHGVGSGGGGEGDWDELIRSVRVYGESEAGPGTGQGLKRS